MTKDAVLLESSFNSVLQEAPEGGLWQEDLATGRRGSITACHCLLAGWEGPLSMRGGTDVYSGSDRRGPAGTRDSHLGLGTSTPAPGLVGSSQGKRTI